MRLADWGYGTGAATWGLVCPQSATSWNEAKNVHERRDVVLRTAFMQSTGARYSAMEHLVPEMMFSTEESPGHGISTVKALALAAEEGQRIWTITEDNLDLALETIDLSANAKTDIRNAVNEGKVVTAHVCRVTGEDSQSIIAIITCRM